MTAKETVVRRLHEFADMLDEKLGTLFHELPTDEYLEEQIMQVANASDMTLHEFMCHVETIPSDDRPDLINGDVQTPRSLHALLHAVEYLY